jgi:transposase
MIGSIDKRIMIEHRSNEASKRLRSIPGIGIVGASAIVAPVADPMAFRSGRDFAAWIGLLPRQDSTGGFPIGADRLVIEACNKCFRPLPGKPIVLSPVHNRH